MSRKTKLIILAIAMALSIFTSSSTGNLFVINTTGKLIIVHIVACILFGGIVNIILFDIDFAKSHSTVSSTLLIVFSVILFPISMVIGSITLIPYMIYCGIVIYQKKQKQIKFVKQNNQGVDMYEEYNKL